MKHLHKLAVLLVLLALVVGCQPIVLSPAATSTPEPDYSVELVAGKPISSPAIAMYAAAADECSTDPLVFDSRPPEHNSLSVLPRLEQDDFDTLQAFYKFEVLDNMGCQRAEPGEYYWDVYALFLECGASNIQPQVYDEFNEKITDRGILLYLSWPGAEQFPVAVDPPYAQRGVGGFTEGGDLGWAYGGESHIGPEGGPYLVWASSDPADWGTLLDHSDAVDHLGWWDDHCEPSPIFRITKKAGSITPPEGVAELVDYDEDGNEIGHIPFITDVPPAAARILGLRIDGQDVGFIEWGR
jgi:hypothetical protein